MTIEAILLAAHAAFSGQVPPAPLAYFTPRSYVMCDQVTVDIKDQPETVAEYRYALAALNQDLNAGGSIVAVISGSFDAWKGLIAQGLFVPALTDGSYSLWAQAIDAAGNPSRWSRSVQQIPIDLTPPREPLNVRWEVRITISGTNP